ncbi:hypothetical protein V8B97DRAFT_2025370 [Scleroderma yunnanense]
MSKHLNQNKPTSHLTDKQIVAEIHKHIDMSEYSIGLTKFVAIQKELGLHCTCQQGHTPESIREIMIKMQHMYPDTGVHKMIGLLFHEHNMAISRSMMHSYFTTYEPHLVKQCQTNCLQHHHFWAAGVNDIWAVDQHDKWQHFGLALHTGIKPFSGQILWMKVWHSNCNPQLILLYYLETIEEFGHNFPVYDLTTDAYMLLDIPLVTQSDPGTENFGIVNVQMLLQQMHDLALEGFEVLLESGVDAGWYDPDNTLQLMIFHWVFIPWLQVELDNYQDHINNSCKCHDRKKVLPHGIPELIYTCAEDYGALDFKVMVSWAAINHVCELYIKANHTVFNLVPPTLHTFINKCYHQLGCPSVGHASAWMVYNVLLGLVWQSMELEETDTAGDDELHLLTGLQDLHKTEGYMGGVTNGMGLHKYPKAVHLQVMDGLSNDEPEIYNEIDTAPLLLVAEFLSEEDDEADEADVKHRYSHSMCKYITSRYYYWAVIGANNSAQVYSSEDCLFIPCGHATPPFPLAIQYVSEMEARHIAGTLQAIVDSLPHGADHTQILVVFNIPSVQRLIKGDGDFYTIIIGSPPGFSKSAAHAKGLFKYLIHRQTPSFWIALAFMIIKGVMQHMPPLVASSEIVVNPPHTTLDSLGEQLHSLNILSPQSISTSKSHAPLLMISSHPPHTASSSRSHPALSSISSYSPHTTSTPSTSHTHSSNSSVPPLLSVSSAMLEMSPSQAAASPIIYSHIRNLCHIVSSHYFPTSTVDIQNLAQPQLGDLVAHYLASHGYGAEDVNLIIQAHKCASNNEQAISFLARRGMTVNKARFLLVLIDLCET